MKYNIMKTMSLVLALFAAGGLTARAQDIVYKVTLDIVYTFSSICRPFWRHVAKKFTISGSEIGVCEVGFKGPSKHDAVVSVVSDKSRMGAQVSSSF